ncbi:MAG: ECF transporter S component [Candidatus Aenigmarchaeota archaeon]|nr:ECF transporter S component [Candidatus Aenigmarchaeota archaeon]
MANPSGTRILSLVVVTSAITGIGFLLTAPIPLIPGAIHWRVLAFLPCVFGILFGPRIGFLSGALGNTLWALLGGYFNLATPIFDLVGVGLTGYIPGKFVKPQECKSGKGLLKAAIVSLISGIIMVPIVAVGFELVGAAPFWAAVYMLALSDLPPILIGTPIVVAALLPVLEARGFLRTRW